MTIKYLAACAIGVAASISHAQSTDPAPIELVLNPVAPGVLATTFTRNVNGLFIDTYRFTPTSFAGTVSVSFAPTSGAVSFGAALLNGRGFGFDPDAGSSLFSFSATVDAGQPLELTVTGFAGDAETLSAAAATYRGTVLAVPEPATYALMLAGLGLVGAMVRRRV